MSWLRKGPLAALAAGLAVVWLLVFFLFDPMLRRAAVAAGEAAAGAEVDLGFVKTKWLKGTLSAGALAVADRESPMKNLFEVSGLRGALDVGAALRGKAVVREAAIEGIRLGTPRASSGALPAAPPPSKLEKAVREKLAGSAPSSVAVKANAVGEVDAAKLAGLKKLDEAKAKSREVEERWKGRSSELAAIEKDGREAVEELKRLKSGSGADLLKQASTADKSRRRISALIERVDALKADAKKDLAEVETALKEADALRKKDIDGLMSAAGLPSMNPEDLAKRLLGAHAASRLATALRWMSWARQKAAARKVEAPPPPPRRRTGVDLEFPRAHSYPQFLLENASLSGTLENLALSGRLTGVTSNPALYGKPALLQLNGASGPASLKLSARLDQQKDPVAVSLKISAEGLSLAGAVLGDGQIGGTVASGAASVDGELRSDGPEWRGEVRVRASGLRLEPKVTLAGPAGPIVTRALASLSGFNARVGISGTEDDLKLSFSSDAGEAVAAAMRKAVSGEAAAQRKALEAKVAALYGGKAREARAQAERTAASVLGPLDAQRSSLERQLKDSLMGGGGKPKLDLKKIFR